MQDDFGITLDASLSIHVLQQLMRTLMEEFEDQIDIQLGLKSKTYSIPRAFKTEYMSKRPIYEEPKTVQNSAYGPISPNKGSADYSQKRSSNYAPVVYTLEPLSIDNEALLSSLHSIKLLADRNLKDFPSSKTLEIQEIDWPALAISERDKTRVNHINASVTMTDFALTIAMEKTIERFSKSISDQKNGSVKLALKNYLNWILQFNKEPKQLLNTLNDLLKDCFSKKPSFHIPRPQKYVIQSDMDTFNRNIDKTSAVDLINMVLNGRNPQPLFVDFCSNIFKGNFNVADSECSYHAGVIAGQRKVRGKIQYLFQNSWGKSCASYPPAWECLAENGAVWIDSDILLPNSLHLFWLPTSN